MLGRLERRWDRRFAGRPASGVAPQEAERRLREAVRDTAKVLAVAAAVLGSAVFGAHAAGVPAHPSVDVVVVALCVWAFGRAWRRARRDDG